MTTTPPMPPKKPDPDMEKPMPEEMKGDEAQYPEFQMPEQLDIPQGESKDVICTIRNNGSGMGCLVAIDGVEIGSKPEAPQDDMEDGDDEGTENNMKKFLGGGDKSMGGDPEEE